MRYGSKPFRIAYNLAFTELHQAGKDAQLKVMNQQIGFYRNMAFASALAGVSIAGESVHGSSLVPAVPWVPFFGLTTWMFIYRYRRFWRYFGDNVTGGRRRRSVGTYKRTIFTALKAVKSLSWVQTSPPCVSAVAAIHVS